MLAGKTFTQPCIPPTAGWGCGCHVSHFNLKCTGERAAGLLGCDLVFLWISERSIKCEKLPKMIWYKQKNVPASIIDSISKSAGKITLWIFTLITLLISGQSHSGSANANETMTDSDKPVRDYSFETVFITVTVFCFHLWLSCITDIVISQPTWQLAVSNVITCATFFLFYIFLRPGF